MVSGCSAVKEDVIPYGFVVDPMGRIGGINVIGLKRRGFGKSDLQALRRAVHDIFAGEGTLAERVERVAAEATPMVAQIVAFIRAAKRPIMLMRQRGGHNLDA
jgi:UDP-N-acetylglucosamine acyltransferase